MSRSDSPGMATGRLGQVRRRDAMLRAAARAWRSHPRLLVATATLTVATALADCVYPLALANVVTGLAGGSSGQVSLGVVLLVAGVGGGWCLRIAGTSVGQVFERRVGMELRSHVVDLHARLPRTDHLEDPEEVTRLELLRHKVYALEQWYGTFFGTLASVLRIGVLAGLALAAQPAAAVLVLLAAGPLVVSVWRERVLEHAQDRAAPAARLSQHFYDVATQRPLAMEVRVLGLQEQAAAHFLQSWRDGYRVTARARLVGLLWLALAWVAFGCALTGVLFFDALEREPGDVVLAAAALGQVTLFVALAATEAPYLRRWTRATRDLAWLEDQANRVATRSGSQAPVPRTGPPSPADAHAAVVQFDDVSFAYPSGTAPVLRNVSFAVPAGAVVAVVGVNGAGKSTLLHLLSGFARPTSGRVLVGGVDLASADLAEMRQGMSASYQEPFHFLATVREVVEMGTAWNGPADPTLLVSAMERSRLAEVVATLPDGLDTALGSQRAGGVDLSGGQWQRLALARSLMRPTAAVLMLDEPSSALDALTERDVLQGLSSRAAQARTEGAVTFVVSHRLSMARLVDLVLVLDAGRLVQSGSHAELIARPGAYRELYLLQAGSYA